MYEDIEVSERQIKEGKVKDARESLLSIKNGMAYNLIIIEKRKIFFGSQG